MKTLLANALIFTSLLTSSGVFAGVAGEKLLSQVEVNLVYRQITSEDRCADGIKLEFSEYKPNWALETDKFVNLVGQRLKPNGERSFVHLNNSLALRKDIPEGTWLLLNHQESAEMGIGNEEKQREQGSLVESEFRVFGVPSNEEISKTTILYDADSNEFVYQFTARKVRPIHCRYVPLSP